MNIPQAHIAGVGITDVPRESKLILPKLAVSAATKALLDAGITYSDVDTSFACFLDDLRVPTSSFDAFGNKGAPVSQLDNRSGLLSASRGVSSGQSNCSLLVTIDTDERQSQTWLIGIVLVSDLFLTSHAYLKDAAVTIRGIALSGSIYSASSQDSDVLRTVRAALDTSLRQANIDIRDLQALEIRHGWNRKVQQALDKLDVAFHISVLDKSFTGVAGLVRICGLVWQLRGWLNSQPPKARNISQVVLDGDGSASSIVLSRSDGRSALTWDEVKNIRDGRERLGYNPAVEMREISREDLVHVKANEHFVPTASSERQLGLSAKGGARAALERL